MENVHMKNSLESKIDDYTNSVKIKKKGIHCFKKSHFDV